MPTNLSNFIFFGINDPVQCSYYNYPSNVWRPSPVPADEDVDQTHRSKQYWFTPENLRSTWPKNHQPPTTLAEMNVEETAIWLEMIARLKGWTEATIYAQSFKTNGISGHMLTYLTVQTLRSDLDIMKFGHRLEIIAAIKDNELTLMTPFIVTIRPNAFNPNEKIPMTFNESSIHWKMNSADKNVNSKKVNERLANALSIQNTSTDDGLINVLAVKPKADGAKDFCRLWAADETGVQMLKKNSYYKMKQKSFTKSRRRKKSLSATKYPWIPPIKLPPAVTDFEGKNRFNEFSLEFDKGGKNSLRSIW